MAAYSDEFPWPNSKGHFDFFERMMHAHDRVRDLRSHGNGRYTLEKNDGARLSLFVCDCYSFGKAEYLETIENFGRLDTVIISSNWCGYTADVKEQCRDEKVGLYNIRDFMAALNLRQLWSYLNDYEKDRLRKKGHL